MALYYGYLIADGAKWQEKFVRTAIVTEFKCAHLQDDCKYKFCPECGAISKKETRRRFTSVDTSLFKVPAEFAWTSRVEDPNYSWQVSTSTSIIIRGNRGSLDIRRQITENHENRWGTSIMSFPSREALIEVAAIAVNAGIFPNYDEALKNMTFIQVERGDY